MTSAVPRASRTSCLAKSRGPSAFSHSRFLTSIGVMAKPEEALHDVAADEPHPVRHHPLHRVFSRSIWLVAFGQYPIGLGTFPRADYLAATLYLRRSQH